MALVKPSIYTLDFTRPAEQTPKPANTVTTDPAPSNSACGPFRDLVEQALIAGRNASGIASELGSMKVSEQIDAMRALGTDPVKKLVTPRLLAMCVTLPLLTIIADFVGIVGGYMVAVPLLRLTTGSQYWNNAWRSLEYNDIAQGLIKPLLFAFIIALVGCLYGMRTTGGTQGVGRATTQAVVVASVWIFIVTALVTRIFVNL